MAIAVPRALYTPAQTIENPIISKPLQQIQKPLRAGKHKHKDIPFYVCARVCIERSSYTFWSPQQDYYIACWITLAHFTVALIAER